MSEITQRLQSSDKGNSGASEELLPLVYEELRRYASARMAHELSGQTLQPTALVHEAWLKLFGNGERHWQDRAHFFRMAAEAMRHILVEKARGRSSIKRGGEHVRMDIGQIELAASMPEEEALVINDALERLELQDPEKARVVVLKFYGGLTNQEVAESMGVTERTIERHWAFAKSWLFQSIRGQK